MGLAANAMELIVRALNNPQISLREKAIELNLTGFKILTYGRDNAIFGKARANNGGHDVLNVPMAVLIEREKLADEKNNRINRSDEEIKALNKLRGKATAYAPNNAWEARP